MLRAILNSKPQARTDRSAGTPTTRSKLTSQRKNELIRVRLAKATQPIPLCAPERDSEILGIQPESFLFQRAGHRKNSISDLGDGLFDEGWDIEKGVSDMPAFNHEVSLAE